VSDRGWLRRQAPTLAALASVALFLLQGCAFLDLPGVQHDEALFAGAILDPREVTASLRFGGLTVPLMLVSYLGCLKAWLYGPVFALWRPDVYSLRVPALLAAGFTIWLLYRLMRRMAGTRAALAACFLLATDTMSVLTSVLDWGPVVLQHLLTVLVLWLAVRFHQTGQRWRLGLAAFCCGLALWDKAAFAWTLLGLALGAAVAFRRELAGAVTRRNLVAVAGCLMVGALPFICSTWGSAPGLIRDAGGFSPSRWKEKLAMAQGTLDGSALFGYLTREDPPPKAAPPGIALDRASVALSDALGNPFEHWLPWAVAAAGLLLPVLWRTPARGPMLFTAVAAFTGWLILAATGRGGAGHHVVLLWPLPQMLVGTAAGQLWRFGRHGGKLVAAGVAAVCLSGLAVTNQYLADLVRRGAALAWTEASVPLARYLSRAAPGEVWALDWGIVGPLRIEGGGRLPVRGWLDMEPGWEVREAVGYRNLISSPQRYLVAHVAGTEYYPGRREALEAFARKQGFRPQTLQVISDRHGRAVFEVFRYVLAGRQ